MATLLLGFVGLVLVPALILSVILNRLVKDPGDADVREEQCRFTISPVKPRCMPTARRGSAGQGRRAA